MENQWGSRKYTGFFLHMIWSAQFNDAITLHWRHNGRGGVSNHRPHDCLLNRLFRRRSKKTPKLRIIGLRAGNSPVTDEFPAQRASEAENVSIWWRHHELVKSVPQRLVWNGFHRRRTSSHMVKIVLVWWLRCWWLSVGNITMTS